MAASRSNWMALKLIAAFLIVTIQGTTCHTANSFISPNSAPNPNPNPNLNNLHLTSAPSLSPSTPHHIQKRSASPILAAASSLPTLSHLLTASPHLADLSHNQLDPLEPTARLPLSPPTAAAGSGEAHGAPQARALAEPPHSSTPAPSGPRPRQASADIQDIITGIVKLLHGQANAQQASAVPPGARPLRPLPSRINNRGPPRIADVPALPPDFDVPAPPLPPPPIGQMPPPVAPQRVPTPYPFDLPGGTVKRPFYRPITIPPWRRKQAQRRPPIPAYKPMPSSFESDSVSFTTEKPIGDVLNVNFGGHLGEEETTSAPVTTDELVDFTTNEEVYFEKNKEKSTSKMVKSTSVVPSSITESNTIVSNDIITTTSTITSTGISTEASTSTIEASTGTSTEVSTENSTVISEETGAEATSTTESFAETSGTKVVPETQSSNEVKAFSTTTHITPTSTTAAVSTSLEMIKVEVELDNSTNLGAGATPVIESSIQEVLQTLKDDLLASSTPTSTPTEHLPMITSTKRAELVSNLIGEPQNATNQGFAYHPYRPRPGIVLDDTEYKPGQRKPIVTRPALGDIFDITVSAVQGPGGAQGKPHVVPVAVEGAHDVITSPVGDEGFVSIDGKRTYLNLFGEGAQEEVRPTRTTEEVRPTRTQAARRPARPRPSQPPVRIDTCIVGDASTCDGAQHEVCRTEAGVSACHCRPGLARRKHREPCRRIVAVLLSMRVDRLYERRVVWASELANRNSESYLQLAYEAERALDSAMSMTPFSDEFLTAKVNSIYRGERAAGQAGVFVNMTLQLDENGDTARASVRADLQKHLLGVIQRRSNNIGNSALFVDSPPGSISNLQDLDECAAPDLHDCHAAARCINVFGGFRCECGDGYRDPWADNRQRAGRECEQCSAQHCNNRGECRYHNGQEVCTCSGNYYGTQCELDGEVLGVAIGASVAAVLIIGLTLVCLVMWSRRWSREHKAAVGSPVFGYMATASNTVKAPIIGAPPYQLTLEDRLRWAQIADVMAQSNHYAPEPVTGPTRPSSALFGYPNLAGTMPMHGTLPPIPLPRLNLQAQMASRAASIHGMRRLDNSSSSEEEDKADLLGRSFHVPRPKSRSSASIANQSGIYYDVDYDQNEIYKQAGGIPLSTYSMGRPSYFRN